ncbi:hypothetical protein QYF61_017124, partial [Mycteria americana]
LSCTYRSAGLTQPGGRTPVWPRLPAGFGHDAPLARGTPLRCHRPPAVPKAQPSRQPISRPSPVGDGPLRPLPPRGPLPASPSRHPARAGETGTSGRDRHQRAVPPAAAEERRAGSPGPGEGRDLPGRRSNPLLATAAAEAAGKRRGGRSGAELRCPTRARGGARHFPPPPRAPPAGAMGWEEKQVRGYPEFVQTAQRYHGRPIFALFCGDKDAEGRSWCPDCVTGEARGARRVPAGGASAGAVGGAPGGGGAPFSLGPRRAAGSGGATPRAGVPSALSPAGTALTAPLPGRLRGGGVPLPAAEPVVRKELHNMPDESVFIYCLVGDRAYWKDPNNEFRKNLKLTGVPTLLKYGTPQKLVEEECFKAELVRMLFTED